MLRHLIRLAWNRKRSNMLLMLEILLAFIVVFSVTTTGLYLYAQYSEPLGFNHENVWTITVSRSDQSDDDSWKENGAGNFNRLLDEIRSMPQVLLADGSNNRPYSGSTNTSHWKFRGRDVRSQMGRAGLHVEEISELELIAGRWFEEGDELHSWSPAVITQLLAEDMFGDEDPIDQILNDESENPMRVVGVIRAYRHHGDFTRPIHYTYQYNPISPEGLPAYQILVKVAPGTTAQFEEDLTERLHGVAPDWGFTVLPLELARSDYFRRTMLPLGLMAIIAGFLLMMVVLGLTGVLWQNVTRRTRELGLRRAVGATRQSIHRQIVGEVMTTGTLGLLLGIVAVVQLPALKTFAFLSFPLVLLAALLSAIAMISLAGACGLYPGWTATRIQPAEALHYE
jgi:putative ABC transport system permease protein